MRGCINSFGRNGQSQMFELEKVRKMVDSRKLKQWQKELTTLTEETGTSLEDICDYLGLSYNRDIGFYVKLPKKRSTYIGIGLALKQPVDVINRWIVTYGNKRRLYSKDISEDLVWIFLIERNRSGNESDTNYYKLYDSFQQAAFETYISIWSDLISEYHDTADVDGKLREIQSGDDYNALKNFVINNIDAFKTAYARPRKLLEKYKDCILATNGKASGKQDGDALNSLRGWLDDSMINYLSGSAESNNVLDMKTGMRQHNTKKIPSSRKAHISLALALGMTVDEVSRYLELMGYGPLDPDDPNENILITELNKWDEEHPLQRAYKEKYLNGDTTVEMDTEDELQAVSDMLMLRQELMLQYKLRKIKFEYMRT